MRLKFPDRSVVIRFLSLSPLRLTAHSSAGPGARVGNVSISRTLIRYVSNLRSKLPSRSTLIRACPVLLMAFGVGLLVYVAIQYGQMYFGQRRLAREWQRQQGRSAESRDAKATDYAIPDDGLTRLSIPKINLQAVVVEGTTPKALLLGPGHLPDTPEPGLPGNSVISGHRDTFFRHVHELEKGDMVTVQREGKVYNYEVTEKKIVGPDDIWVLRPTRESRLTLITCYPTYYVGPAPERLVVFSKLLKDPELSTAHTAPEITPATTAK
ncbi:MAG: class D sortase [Terriglobales bacterium]